jgi:hypothetical protein
MKNALAIAVAGALALGAFGVAGCQSDENANYDADARTRPSVDTEMGGGMNRTGAGSDDGSSASGMDRSGGGFSGSHGDNSGAIGSSPRPAAGRITADDQWTLPGALPPEEGSAGVGGAPAPGR